MKFLALHILFSPFDLVSGSKIGAMLSVSSEATTKERDVFDNTQIATSLYIIIWIRAFNVNLNRYIAVVQYSSV